MTISSAISRVTYPGEDSVGPFSFSFKILAATDLVVTKADSDGTETTLSYSSQYTVTGVGRSAGGSVTLVTALATGETLTIRRVLPLTQSVDIANQGGGPAFPSAIEAALDRSIMVAQQQQETLDRTFRLPETEEITDEVRTLPPADERASKFLAFDSDGQPIASNGGITGVPVSSFMENPVQAASGAAFYAAVPFTPVGTGAVQTSPAIKFRERLSLFDFCSDADKSAVRAGTQTDVTVAFLLAVAEACDSGRDLEINEGTPVIGDGLVLTKGIRLWGHGMRSLVYVDSAFDSGTDVITLSPDAANDAAQTGYHLDGFYVLPVSGTPGRHTIAIDITTRPVYESKFTRLRLNALGGTGIITLPNASPLTNGFFTSKIADSVIYGGINLDKAGDSLRIVRNTITGAGGITVDVVGTSPSEAHLVDISQNNITCAGNIRVINGSTIRIRHNNIEAPSASTSTSSALVDLDGTSGSPIYNATVEGNFLGGGSGNVDRCVRVNYAIGAVVKDNLTIPGAGKKAYTITSHAIATKIKDDTLASYGILMEDYLDDSGLGTHVEWSTPSGSGDQRVRYSGHKSQNVTGVIHEAGKNQIAASLIWAVLNATTAVADLLTKGWLRVFGNGNVRVGDGADNGANLQINGSTYFTGNDTHQGVSVYKRGAKIAGTDPDDEICNIAWINDADGTIILGYEAAPTGHVRDGIIIFRKDGTEKARIDGTGLKIGPSASSTSISRHISATKTWDAGSVADGASATTTVTVANAAVGDTVTVGLSVDLAGLILTGYVSTSGTVTVVLGNLTGSPVDLASATLRADVWQH